MSDRHEATAAALFESFAGRTSFFVWQAPRAAKGKAWWSQTGSNRRPHACKARALPAELWPRTFQTTAPVFAFQALPGTLRSVWRGCATRSRRRSVVGLGRLELPTSRLSSARSNQLSYKPLTLNPSSVSQGKDRGPARCNRPSARCIAQAQSPWRVFVREERETKTAKSRQRSSTMQGLLAPDVSKTIR